MAVLAQLQEDGRSAERRDLGTDTTLRLADRPVDILIADISATGCLFICPEQIPIGADVTIGIPGRGRRMARIVRNEHEKYGCVFLTSLNREDLAGAFGGGHGNLVAFPCPAGEVGETAPLPVDEVNMLPLRGRLLLIAGLATLLWAALLLPVIGSF